MEEDRWRESMADGKVEEEKTSDLVGRELCTSPSGIPYSSYELPEDLQGCDEAALPLSHTKLLVRGGT